MLHLFYWVEVHLCIPDPRNITYKRGRLKGVRVVECMVRPLKTAALAICTSSA